jgi:hypothetical protein
MKEVHLFSYTSNGVEYYRAEYYWNGVIYMAHVSVHHTPIVTKAHAWLERNNDRL